MVARPYWKGQIRLALVSCGIELISATTETEKIKLNRIEQGTGTKLKQQNINPDTGDVVTSDQMAMGFEYEKGRRWIEIPKDELDALKIESSEIINIEKVVPQDAVNPLYQDATYLVMPSGKNDGEIFATIREALRVKKVVGLGRMVVSKRERAVLVKPEGNGMILATLHDQDEVRSPAEYFDDIPDVKVDKQNLELATTLIGKMSSEFDLTMFDDRYQIALKALIDSKVKGAPTKLRQAVQPAGKYGDLFSALKASIAGEGKSNVTPIRPKIAVKPIAGAKPKGKRAAGR